MVRKMNLTMGEKYYWEKGGRQNEGMGYGSCGGLNENVPIGSYIYMFVS